MDNAELQELQNIINTLEEAAISELLEAARRVRDFYQETVPYEIDSPNPLPLRWAKMLPATDSEDFPFDLDEVM